MNRIVKSEDHENMASGFSSRKRPADEPSLRNLSPFSIEVLGGGGGGGGKLFTIPQNMGAIWTPQCPDVDLNPTAITKPNHVLFLIFELTGRKTPEGRTRT